MTDDSAYSHDGGATVLQVYGQTVTVMEHLSDIWRADIMLKYGGVYLDTDVVMVRPLTDQLRAYDVVVSYDCVNYWDMPFPDTLNLGVIVSKPAARFWELCLVSLIELIDVIIIISSCCSKSYNNNEHS